MATSIESRENVSDVVSWLRVAAGAFVPRRV
jgi:hypothetical protein